MISNQKIAKPSEDLNVPSGAICSMIVSERVTPVGILKSVLCTAKTQLTSTFPSQPLADMFADHILRTDSAK